MTLFTGSEESTHGVPGFVGLRPPFARHSILETISGFDTRWLRHPQYGLRQRRAAPSPWRPRRLPQTHCQAPPIPGCTLRHRIVVS